MDVDQEDWQMVAGKRRGKKVEITLDSGAGASCWPMNLWKGVPMGPKAKGVKFKAANGSELKYFGTKNVRFMPTDGVKKDGGTMESGMCEMKFHVTDTTKPLAAAMAMVKLGNRNIATGDKVMLRERGGTFVFDVEDLGAGKAHASTFARQG